MDKETIEKTKPIPLYKWIFIAIGDFFIKFGKFLLDIVLLLGKSILNIFIGAYKGVIWLGKTIYQFSINTYRRFIDGGWRTKVSHFFMGIGHFFMERPLKAIIYLVAQIGYFVYMFLPKGGFYWLSKFRTLGDVATETVEYCREFLPAGAVCHPDDLATRTIVIDNSMLIMIFAVATILLSIAFFTLYFVSVQGVKKAEDVYVPAREEFYLAQKEAAETNSEEPVKFTNPLPTAKEEAIELLNSRFHFTTLSIPTITITVFTVLPLIFMILIAFTNWDNFYGPPDQLFSWVGLQTFAKLFALSDAGTASFGSAMLDIVKWTFIWAIFATFTNYIGGMLLAMIINKRSIKAKKVWRIFFVISIAIPQFVTLLLMSKLLATHGPLNGTLLEWGWIKEPILFLENAQAAKITVIIVNFWIGVPYTMLITSGILMNIPADLYESAKIDGAGPVTQFTKITLPYMLFVTGPYLITQFIGNINNFNVIFFLTGGGPATGHSGVPYGHTDILITWLFKLTVGDDRNEFAIGSALGILIFLISAFITLTLYSRTAAAQQEGDFA